MDNRSNTKMSHLNSAKGFDPPVPDSSSTRTSALLQSMNGAGPPLIDWSKEYRENAKYVSLCAITDQFQKVPGLENTPASKGVALPPFRKTDAVIYLRHQSSR